MSNKTEPRQCNHCGARFDALVDNIKQGWGKFCSRRCAFDWRKAQPRTLRKTVIRQLRPGDPVPQGEPKRYNRAGYVVLRWRVGKNTYVEFLEHRLIAGEPGKHVHHKNGRKDDNRPENLEPLTASAHCMHHQVITWDVDEAAKLYSAGWSLPELSRKYGVHFVTVLRGFERRGIKRRTPGESRRQYIDGSVFIELYARGIRLGAMAKQLGVSRGAVERARQELDLAPFPIGRPSRIGARL